MPAKTIWGATTVPGPWCVSTRPVRRDSRSANRAAKIRPPVRREDVASTTRANAAKLLAPERVVRRGRASSHTTATTGRVNRGRLRGRTVRSRPHRIPEMTMNFVTAASANPEPARSARRGRAAVEAPSYAKTTVRIVTATIPPDREARGCAPSSRPKTTNAPATQTAPTTWSVDKTDPGQNDASRSVAETEVDIQSARGTLVRHRAPDGQNVAPKCHEGSVIYGG